MGGNLGYIKSMLYSHVGSSLGVSPWTMCLSPRRFLTATPMFLFLENLFRTIGFGSLVPSPLQTGLRLDHISTQMMKWGPHDTGSQGLDFEKGLLGDRYRLVYSLGDGPSGVVIFACPREQPGHRPSRMASQNRLNHAGDHFIKESGLRSLQAKTRVEGRKSSTRIAASNAASPMHIQLKHRSTRPSSKTP